MPGLSQLKKFNEDMLSLGNEPALRSARGERPVTVPIPKDIKDINDADDFLTGMPEVQESFVKEKKEETAPEDFSDIMGTSSAKKEEGESVAESPINLSVPDLSSLGAFDVPEGTDTESAIPDLSMFAEPEVEEEPEPEPEEPEIADLGLEALLSGAGFDGSEGQGEYSEEDEDSEYDTTEQEEPVELDSADLGVDIENETDSAVENTKTSTLSEADDILSNLGFPNTEESHSLKSDSAELESIPVQDDFSELSELPVQEDKGELDTSAVEDISLETVPLEEDIPNLEEIPLEDAPLEELSEPEELLPEESSLEEISSADSDIASGNDISLDIDSDNDINSPDSANSIDTDISSASDIASAGIEPLDVNKEEELSVPDDIPDISDIPDLTDDIQFSGSEDFDSGTDFDLPSDLFGDVESLDSQADDSSSVPPAEDFSLPLEENFSENSTETLGADDFSLPDESISTDEISSPIADDFNLPDDFSDSPATEKPISTDESPSTEDFPIEENLEPIQEDTPELSANEEIPDLEEPLKDADFSDISGFDLDVPDFSMEDEPSLSADSTTEKISPEAVETDKEFSFDGSAIDLGEDLPEDISELQDVPQIEEEPAPQEAENNSESSSEFNDTPDGLFDAGDFDFPDLETSDFSDSTELSSVDSLSSEDAPFSADSNELPSMDELSSIEEPAATENLSSIEENSSEAEVKDASVDDALSALDSFGDFSSSDLDTAGLDESSQTNTENTENSSDFPSGFDFDLSDMDSESVSSDSNIDESSPIETYDTSAMEGLDFGITETDNQIQNKGEFELGSSDDFALDGGDFEIPGFSDVQTVEVNKNGKIKVPGADAAPKEEEVGSDLPPNTLSDSQYEKFLKNLSTYPLNVRMAVEELFAKNEFTDDAEFSIVQKVLKKVSARQLASELEKMLDIAISVPRDFERRTAEEYEAYKSSFQYQLSNKIIPGAIVSVAALVVCYFMFQFARYFVYRPIRANALYSQGYKLLESEDFPLSETRFSEAVRYDLQKKWFFKYARGYKDHKQYIRAEQMYNNILHFFKHDKQAGLEYARMEIDDLANYEKAEQILLRDVLDYHINDADGILLLGDNYLEWAGEKDESKYELALNRYSELVQLYGQTDQNMSRIMRYYIRTDNLLEVLQLKERFFPRPKSLSAQDWTELSGYCLDKLYGKLSPSDEYLRSKIEDVKEMLVRAVKADSSNPLALYNISKYYVHTHNSAYAKETLNQTINAFSNVSSIKKRDVYKYIDSHRLLGENYADDKDYIKALESFTNGINLYKSAHIGSGLEGTEQVGKLYSDVADIEYFVAGEYDKALGDYMDSISCGYDNGELRYKIGYIQYSKNNYSEAIGSFMKASEEYADDSSLLLAMGNTLSLRNDNYAAQGYYHRLLEQIDSIREQKGILFPQVHKDEGELVDTYMKASNNLGVTLFRLALRTGSSAMNAQAMVKLQDSIRAWDSLTRNQETLVRLSGSNLAEQNLKYVTHPMPEFEPAIYTDIPLKLSVEEDYSR